MLSFNLISLLSSSASKQERMSLLLDEASPGVRVLMADLRGHRRTVAGVKSVAAHRVHRVPHHGSDGRARGEPPVGRIWQSKQRYEGVGTGGAGAV